MTGGLGDPVAGHLRGAPATGLSEVWQWTYADCGRERA